VLGEQPLKGLALPLRGSSHHSRYTRAVGRRRSPHWLLARTMVPATSLLREASGLGIGHTKDTMADEPLVECRLDRDLRRRPVTPAKWRAAKTQTSLANRPSAFEFKDAAVNRAESQTEKITHIVLIELPRLLRALARQLIDCALDIAGGEIDQRLWLY
jgi:hypothetical protein